MEITKKDVAVVKEMSKKLPDWLVHRINTAISTAINTAAIKSRDDADIIICLDKGDTERYGSAIIVAMCNAGYSYVSDKSSSRILVFWF